MASPLECPICFRFYDDGSYAPCALICGHSFCISHSGEVILCPICRTPVPADLKINFTIRDLAMAFARSSALLSLNPSQIFVGCTESQNASRTPDTGYKDSKVVNLPMDQSTIAGDELNSIREAAGHTPNLLQFSHDFSSGKVDGTFYSAAFEMPAFPDRIQSSAELTAEITTKGKKSKNTHNVQPDGRIMLGQLEASLMQANEQDIIFASSERLSQCAAFSLSSTENNDEDVDKLLSSVVNMILSEPVTENLNSTVVVELIPPERENEMSSSIEESPRSDEVEDVGKTTKSKKSKKNRKVKKDQSDVNASLTGPSSGHESVDSDKEKISSKAAEEELLPPPPEGVSKRPDDVYAEFDESATAATEAAATIDTTSVEVEVGGIGDCEAESETPSVVTTGNNQLKSKKKKNKKLKEKEKVASKEALKQKEEKEEKEQEEEKKMSMTVYLTVNQEDADGSPRSVVSLFDNIITQRNIEAALVGSSEVIDAVYSYDPSTDDLRVRSSLTAREQTVINEVKRRRKGNPRTCDTQSTHDGLVIEDLTSHLISPEMAATATGAGEAPPSSAFLPSCTSFASTATAVTASKPEFIPVVLGPIHQAGPNQLCTVAIDSPAALVATQQQVAMNKLRSEAQESFLGEASDCALGRHMGSEQSETIIPSGFHMEITEEAEAEQAYVERMKTSPDDVRNVVSYARYLARRRRPDEAEAKFQAALELNPRHAEAAYFYARFLENDRRDNRKAEQLYKISTEEEPRSGNALYYYGRLLHLRKEHTQARHCYEKSLEINPKHTMTLASYARLLEYVYLDYNMAEEMYRRSCEVDPHEVQNLALTGYAIFLYTVRHEVEKAQKMFDESLAMDPNDSYTLSSYAGFLWNCKKDMNGAEGHFQKSLRMFMGSPNTLATYGHFLEIVRHDFDGALKMFREALQLDPNHIQTLLLYANFCHHSLQSYALAEELYERALQIDPSHIAALIQNGILQEITFKNYQKAEICYLRAMRSDSRNATAIHAMAKFSDLILKKDAEAEELYKRALQLNNRSAATHYYYANFLMHHRNDDSSTAEYHYRKGLEYANKHEQLFKTMLSTFGAFLYAGKKDYDGAEMIFKQLLDIDCNISLVALTLWAEIVCYHRPRNDSNVALMKALWMRVLSIKPNSTKTQQELVDAVLTYELRKRRKDELLDVNGCWKPLTEEMKVELEAESRACFERSKMVIHERNVCSECFQPGKHACSKCNRTLYCSKTCQVNHWKIHKKNCPTFVQETQEVNLWRVKPPGGKRPI